MAERLGDVVFRVDKSDNESDIWDDSALIKAYDKAINSVKGMTKGRNEEKKDKKQPRKKRGGKGKNRKHSLQSRWRVGDRCKAVFTEDDQVYRAVIRDINERRSSCRIKYIGYGNEEDKRLSDLFSESEVEMAGNANYGLENGYDSMEWTDHSQSPMRPTSSGLPKRSHHPPPPHPHPHPYPYQPYSSYPHSYPLGYPHPYGSWNPPPPIPPPPPPTAPMPPPMTSPLPFVPWGSPNPHMVPPWTGATPKATHQPPTIPQGPPPPLPPHTSLPEDVEDIDNEALHSMLMSWYMSGYHTGFYQGLKSAKTGGSSSTAKGAEGEPSQHTQGRQTRSKTRAQAPEKSSATPPPSQEAPASASCEEDCREGDQDT